MVTKSDEEDVKETIEKKVEAVVKKKMMDWQSADEIMRTKEEDLNKDMWLELFAKLERGIPFTLHHVEAAERNRQRTLDYNTRGLVERFVVAVKYLIATMDEFFPPSSMQVQAKMIRSQIAEMHRMVEWMSNFNQRNGGTRAPVNRDSPGSPNAHKPSSTDDQKKKDANSDIRDKFSANKKPDPKDKRSDEEIESQQRSEDQHIKDGFAASQSEAAKLVNLLEGDNEGEDTSVTTNQAQSAFVLGGGTGKIDNDDGGGKGKDHGQQHE